MIIAYSASLENLILPSSFQTSQVISNYGTNTSFYSFFDKPVVLPNHEAMIFLGYSVIFLSVLAVIRYRQNHTWFWLLICGIFILMSLYIYFWCIASYLEQFLTKYNFYPITIFFKTTCIF